MCYGTGKYTVCWHIHAFFSPEILQAGTVKRLICICHPDVSFRVDWALNTKNQLLGLYIYDMDCPLHPHPSQLPPPPPPPPPSLSPVVVLGDRREK